MNCPLDGGAYGGGRGNTTDILERILLNDVRSVLLGNFVDPEAAKKCHAAGVGAVIELTLNDGSTDVHARSIRVRLQVLALSNGIIVGRRGVVAGRTMNLGPSAAVRIGGLTMVICTRRVQCTDPAYFSALGLDVGSYCSFVVKSRGHFRAGFDEWYEDDRIFEVDAAGLTSPILERYSWKKLPRPVWPLDSHTTWLSPSLESI